MRAPAGDDPGLRHGAGDTLGVTLKEIPWAQTVAFNPSVTTKKHIKKREGERLRAREATEVESGGSADALCGIFELARGMDDIVERLVEILGVIFFELVILLYDSLKRRGHMWPY